jgi:probable HAF family extracellular repeat protein
MNAVTRSVPALASLAGLLSIAVPGPAIAADWEDYRLVPEAVTWPEDLEDFTLVAISGDASAVAGNEVADWNLFPDNGPWAFRYQYPFVWTDGMEQIREIAPNTDEIIEFSNGYRGRVHDMSRDGKWVVGEYAFANSGRHQAFLYDVENDLFEYLGDFGWTWLEINAPDKYIASVATGVSGDGSVVVGWALNTEGRQRAFRWTREEGMVQVFDEMISIWDDDPENWMLAISDDGSRSVAGSSRLRAPNDTERVSTLFALDDFTVSASFPMPNTFSLLDVAEVSGPDNSVLLTILSELGPSPEPWRFPELPFESMGIRWFPLEDRYEAYSEFTYSRALSAFAQTDDGNLMTLLMTGFAPADGLTNYGLLWTPEDGLLDATEFLANTYEIDFDQSAIAKVLPSRDGSTLVAEVYTTSGHHRKALARFDISGEPAPMAKLFPVSWYDDGWRITSMGRLHSEAFPWLWWRNFGWIYMDTAASTPSGMWFWHPELGWCLYSPEFGSSRFTLFSMDTMEWIYVHSGTGWLHSASRSWFRLLE